MEYQNTVARTLIQIARLIMLAVVFLVPILFLSSALIPLATLKLTLVAIAIGVVGILVAVATLLEKRLTIPSHGILYGALAVLSATILAAMFSPSIWTALWGNGFERDSFLAISAFMGALILTPLIFDSARSLERIWQAISASFVVLVFFHVIRLLFGAESILPSIFSTSQTSTLLGSWNDVAVFGGLVVLMATSWLLFSIERYRHRVVLLTLIVLGMLPLIVVNVSVVWGAVALGLFALIIYRLAVDATWRGDDAEKKITKNLAFWVANGLLTFSLFFLLLNSFISPFITNALGVAQVDVRPSWEGTLSVGGSVYNQQGFLFGSGLSTFNDAWELYKENGINSTAFWNTSFNFGVGFIPTLFIVGGIVVGLAWMVLLFFVLQGGVMLLQGQREGKYAAMHHLLTATFVGAVYLWVLLLVYVPQTAMITIAMVLTGAFLASMIRAGKIPTRTLEFKSSIVHAFALPAGLLIVVLWSGSLVVFEGSRALAAAQVGSGVSAYNNEEYDVAATRIARAAFFARTNDTEVARAQFAQAQLSTKAVELDIETEVGKSQLQELLGQVITTAQAVVNQDRADYQNWVFLAQAYELVGSAGIEGAYDNALSAYHEAKVRAPYQPVIPVLEARAAYANGNSEQARAFIKEALALKQDYTDAYYLLSQIEIEEGNLAEAIQSSEAAVILSPDNSGLVFQLGVLYYSAEQNESAQLAFERAVTLNPEYANALYFLGLTYDRLGDAEKALDAFKKVATLNPDNEEIAAIIAGLESGSTAAAVLNEQALPPAEGRDELPVEEE